MTLLEMRVIPRYLPLGLRLVWKLHPQALSDESIRYAQQLTHALPGLHSQVGEAQKLLSVELRDEFILSDYVLIR